ncbi:NCS2 family permease [Arhodomonas sp. AD133]|uniref:NCS2 family permease n=1 Tax=Arhodomonas sp. AD133 TaxID=3415009 RepID=UPI003EBC6752
MSRNASSVADAVADAGLEAGEVRGGVLERLFGISRHGSSVRTEILAGLATFLAGMYIIVVNPSVLNQAGIPFSQALTATVLISFLGSLAMGLYARNPFLVAPGLGMSALFTYTLVEGAGIPWEVALGCVFWSGVLFAVLALFNVRKHVVDAIPESMRFAITSGIGLFITLIGFKNAGFVVSNPATVVSMASLDATVITFLVGLAITGVLVARRASGALVLGIVLTTLAATPIGRLWGSDEAVVNWQGLVAAPDFGGIMRLEILEALNYVYWPFIFVFLFTNFFDAMSTFMGVCEAANLKDENGNPHNIRQSMFVDALASALAAPLGTGAGQTFIESGAGVAQGGRTGLVAVVVALLFLPFLFLSPLLSLVPAIATAPVLIMVGTFMMEPIRRIDWSDYEIAVPAFITVVLMPFTYSITLGIAFGFLAFIAIKLCLGKLGDIKPAMWIAGALSILLLVTTG